ncbi:MAG TPA: hypothetical protein VFZ47_10300 [Chitinophagaceae bacterium]
MKYLSLPSFLLFFLLVACESNDRKPGSEPETDIDAARDFIRASLDGNFKKARNYMLNDSANEERMNLIERVNQNLSPDEKKGLAASSINIHNVTPVNDSATVVIYSNSYKNNWDTLRVLKQQGKWLVDFVYLWEHDKDTLVQFKTQDPLP